MLPEVLKDKIPIKSTRKYNTMQIKTYHYLHRTACDKIQIDYYSATRAVSNLQHYTHPSHTINANVWCVVCVVCVVWCGWCGVVWCSVCGVVCVVCVV